MLAYPVGEACDLLDTKLSGARQKMSDCQEDLDFLREQITVSRRSNVEFITDMLMLFPDSRSRYGKGLQLGRRTEAEREVRTWW